MPLETKIYERGNSLNLKKLFKETLSDVYRSRFLARQLASRDIKSQYRQSFLGIFWAFLMPLSTAFVWIFINDSGAVELADTGVPYPLFVFSGTLLFSALTEAINMPLTATNGAKSLFTKINIPKEAIILAGLYKLLYNDMFKMILLVFFFVFFSVTPTWGMLLFPISFFILTLVGITIGLLITPLGLLYNDVAKVISLSLRFIMFITP
ncbi:MAG: ABC transporter permease, partial [Nonlabens sp.]|nr:ABC transporter permease [Nonlabens sp.]